MVGIRRSSIEGSSTVRSKSCNWHTGCTALGCSVLARESSNLLEDSTGCKHCRRKNHSSLQLRQERLQEDYFLHLAIVFSCASPSSLPDSKLLTGNALSAIHRLITRPYPRLVAWAALWLWAALRLRAYRLWAWWAWLWARLWAALWRATWITWIAAAASCQHNRYSAQSH